MVIAVFDSDGNISLNKDLWQYDYGQVLRIQGLRLPSAVEIHFALHEHGGESIPRIGITKDSITDVVIPDSVLENSDVSHDYYIYAFVYLTDDTSGQTEYQIAINVKSRPKPEGYNSEDSTMSAILKAVNSIADGKADGLKYEDNILSLMAGEKSIASVTIIGGSGSGTDGREVELQNNGTHIQWRYEGEEYWTNLIALEDIKGPAGPAGEKGDPGTITPEQISGAVEEYFASNPIEETDPTIPSWAKEETPDKTLSKEGKAADAKEVGDRLSLLSDEIDNIEKQTNEQVVSAVNSYLDKNPVSALDASNAEPDQVPISDGNGSWAWGNLKHGTTDQILPASSVSWNQTALDIANNYRTRNAVLLSTEGNLAHNACACLCDNVIANIWAENTSGGTSDNANSDGQVHSKLRFTYDRLGVMYKVNTNTIDVDSTTYDLFHAGTEIEGVDGNIYAVVSDSDNMILYVNSTLHIFTMVYGSDGNTHIVHTSGTVTRSDTTVTWTPTNVYKEVSLVVDGESGVYDFTRINSGWMKTPQINTQPNVRSSDTYFALSINGKGIAIMMFDNTDVTTWNYQKFIESEDINLEVSLVNSSWVSNLYPVWVTVHRTKNGYAKIIGYDNNFNILQIFLMPAANTRVRIFGANATGASKILFLICGDSDRNSGSVYMYNFATTPNLSKPVCVWHSDSNITDYISGFINKTSGNSYLYLIGTNRSAKEKKGVSANCMLWNVSLYDSIADNLFALLTVSDGNEVSY